MNIKEVEPYITVLEPSERVIAQPAIFAGMHPGEVLALQRRHLSRQPLPQSQDRAAPLDIDTPKTNS